MSAYIADRDALAKALAKWLCSEKHNAHPDTYCCNCLSRAECVGAPALIASGAVIDAAALADDEALIADTAYALAEGEATYAASTVRYVLRSLAAALKERAQ